MSDVMNIQDAKESLSNLGFNIDTKGPWDSVTGNAASHASELGQIDFTDFFDTDELQKFSLTELKHIFTEHGASSQELSALMEMVHIENRCDDEFVYIDNTVPFVGLGQFDRATWDAIMHLPYKFAADPMLAANAMLLLLRSNAKVWSNQFGTNESDMTGALAYLYHNQGAGAAKQYLKTGVLRNPGQSMKALSVFKRAEKDFALLATV